jgi:alpha-N-arabinofuranosidase
MKARLHVEKDFRIAAIDPRLYSSFIEHLGRSVYGGIYEPGHPSADGKGLRRDVIELVRELAPPLVRYPGGNFVCTFDWEDSVGPVESRPRRLDPAWRSIEPNLFGLDEFMSWTRAAGTEPMLATNLATRGVDAARSLLEYCNFEKGSYWSDLRRGHGAAEPYRIKTWCLGNEMDGPWQVGQKSALEYGRLANEAGKAMRLLDPGIELVACGSSLATLPTFPSWDAEVLDLCYDQVDYLSLHSYYDNRGDDLADFLAASAGMEAFIESVAATCDYVKAKKRSGKTMMLSFDEWNVWFRAGADERDKEPWQVGPRLLEEIYTFEDALAVGCLLMALMRSAKRVKIACLAQLVNAIAPIVTEKGGPAWRQTIFYPFLHASRFGRGTVMDARTECPVYESRRYGEVPFLDAAVVADSGEAGGGLTVFSVNRSPEEAIDLELALGGFGKLAPLERIEYVSDGPKAVNGAACPCAVVPRARDAGIEEVDGHGRLRLEPRSWNVLRLTSAF